MKYPYAILVLMILLTGCSTPLTTRQAGAGIGTSSSAASRNGIDNLKQDQDYESSRGRISD